MSRNDQMVLLGFVPALVVQYLTTRQENIKLPDKQSFRSVVMFADISGFTNLTETLSKIGPEGAELIAFAINRYMELLVSSISKSGGDIFKFAGDAMIVVWPPSQKENRVDQYEELKIICRQAIQSALDIQSKLDNTTIFEDIKLSVKIGFGIGEISIIYLGGVFGRSEYIATGDPLTQAFQSEHQATQGGQIIVSKQVFEMIQDYFIFEKNENLHEGFHQVVKLVSKVKLKADALLIKNNINNFEKIKDKVLTFIPAAVIPYFELQQEKWASELRIISTVFINLGIDLSDVHTEEGLNRKQTVIEIVQKCVYMHEGSLNKLLMDDKGSTLIVCFGLPPLMHQDDASRAILASQLLIQQLNIVNCKCRIGIATGTVFTGVVGTSGSRREYSVLGDTVNLAARLMQTAVVNKRNLLICEQTAKMAQHKILCKFWKDVEMKGKSGLLPVYELSISDEPAIRTHYHTIPNTKQDMHDFDKRATLSGIYEGIIGQQSKVMKILETICSFLQSDMEGKISSIDFDTERDFLLVKGGYGIGKSFIMRSILNQVRKDWVSPYKYQQQVVYIEVSLNSIERSFQMNGFRKVVQKLYDLITKKGIKDILATIAEGECLYFLEELLGIREKDIVSQFPNPNPVLDKSFEKQLKESVIKLFEMYFEIKLPKQKKVKIIPRKRSSMSSMNLQDELYDSLNSDDLQSVDISVDRQSQNTENMVAPIIFCFDDLQYYDSLSFYMIKSVIKKFSRVFMIGISREKFWEIQLMSRNESSSSENHQQEIIYNQGVDSIIRVYNVTTTEIVIKRIHMNHTHSDQERLLKWHFGFQRFIKESQIKSDAMKQSNSIRKKLDHLLLCQNKYQLMHMNFHNYVSFYLHLKTHGQPLLLLNLINILIQQGYLIIDLQAKEAMVSQDLIQILIHDEWLQIPAPLAAVQMNSPLIDSLSCLNLLILKFAAVIGDIFDIQTLIKILSFKQINHQRLISSLKILASRDIIEFMHDDQDTRYYRFVKPFMREVLYQRMTYSQRRTIHAQVAETMQLIPQPFDYDENKELNRLEYHWKIAEYRVSIKQPKMPLKFSHKAKKSLIVKQIQKILEKNNDPKTPLRQGYIYKQSEKKVYWQYRYCELNSQELLLYDSEEKQKMTLMVPLQRITTIQPVFESLKTPQSAQYGLQISVSNYVRKDREQTIKRNFLFAVDSEDELEEWVIFLEFAKAKAIYQDFVANFGKISLPINLLQEAYDPVITMLIREIHTLKRNVESQICQQFKRKESQASNPQTNSQRPIHMIAPRSSISPIGKRFSVRFSGISEIEEKIDSMNLKEKLREFISKGLLIFSVHLISRIQENECFSLGQEGRFLRTHKKMLDISIRKVSSLPDLQFS